MVDNEKRLTELLSILQKADVLKDIIVIGSWAVYLYERKLDNFVANIRTVDIDFYVPNVKRIKQKVSLINELEKSHYYILTDRLTNKSKFKSPDGFELEFLTKLTRLNENAVELGNTDIYAETLSYVDIFSNNFIEINFNGLMVKVASPSSYILQKLIINERRIDKGEKDIITIKNLLFYIHNNKHMMKELKDLYDSLPPKWKAKINSTCDKNNIKLFY